MKTVNEISKIKAVVLYILQNIEAGADFIKLFKIMYFAQQENLVKYGKPIFNETFHALKHGPVPSFTYKCFQVLDGRVESKQALDMFVHSFYVKEAKFYGSEQPDMEELSKSDIKSLDSAISKYKDIDSYELSDLSHQDKAYTEAYTRAQDDPEKDRMSLLEIARSGNATAEMLEYIRNKEQLKKALLF
jgi:uncharacterized phage-associated protein